MRNFVQYLIAFCSRPETSSDVTSGRIVRLIVLDRFIKSETVFYTVFVRYNFRPEVDNVAITGVVVSVKFSDSW